MVFETTAYADSAIKPAQMHSTKKLSGASEVHGNPILHCAEVWTMFPLGASGGQATIIPPLQRPFHLLFPIHQQDLRLVLHQFRYPVAWQVARIRQGVETDGVTENVS